MNITSYLLPLTKFLVHGRILLHTKRSSMNRISQPSANMTVITSSLLILVGFVAPATHAANLLFRSNFGPGISLGPLYNFSSTGAWQAISGTDKETGYSWPVSALDSDFSGIQLITARSITPSTISDHITNEIKSVTGPQGKIINELFQRIKIKGTIGTGGAQAPLLIDRSWKMGDVKNLYITYWFKYQADLESQLDITVPTANWRTQFAFKTGGYLDTWRGDYRITVYVMKGSDNKLYWTTKGDNIANGPFTPIDYWVETNRVVPVPIDKWAKFEVYWHRSDDNNGRFWAAVDGQVIVDHYGSNIGDYNLPITRIFVSNPYSGGRASVDNHITALEIWDNFPCGAGIPCYDKKTIEYPESR